MSDEKKPGPSRPADIQVRRMRFVRPMDIPGQSVTEGVDAPPLDPKRPQAKRYEITFMPQMRHFLIVLTEADRGKQVRYVHESHVATWEPML